MVPENIPIESYTHINFAFASIDPKTYNVTPAAPDQTSLYTRFTGLKKKQPGLKTWISIGNWAFTNPGPAQNTFSRLVASSSAKTGFYVSLIGFMKEYDFDGVDIYW
jgi:chitinase